MGGSVDAAQVSAAVVLKDQICGGKNRIMKYEKNTL